MGSLSEPPKRLLCWQICAYRKPGMTEEDYHRYLSETHAPILAEIMVRHNVIQWTMVRLLNRWFRRFSDNA